MNAKYVGYRIAQSLSLGLPADGAFRCAEGLADLQWRYAARDRRAVERNLAFALGAHAVGSRMSREVFRSFGRYLVEFFTIHRVQAPDVHVEGAEHLAAAQRRARGTIVLTAHLGNWEVGAALIHRMGYAVSAVALPHEDPHMDRLFNAQRRRCGIRVIPLGRDAARESLGVLHDGQVLGLLGDREFARQGLRVECCGGEMTLPRGPATLSMRSQAAVVPTFLIREGRWRFRLFFEPPIWPEATHRGEDQLRALTRQYARVIERYVKRFASQWLMFQPIQCEAGG